MKPKANDATVDQVNDALAQAKGGFTGKQGSKDQQADAFINLAIVDAEGQAHTFSRGFNPVVIDRSRLERSLYNKAKANGGEVEITVKATVRIVEKDDGTDIEL